MRIGAIVRKTAAAWLAAPAFFLGAASAQVGPYENTTVAAINSTTVCSSPVTRAISVAESFAVADLDVGFLATHTWRTDIQLDLTSPAGTTVRLINAPTNVNYDNYNVLLDDEAATLINTGSHAASDGVSAPPYQSRVRPNNALSAFDGQNAQGTWTLTICDAFPSADDGQFVRANLYFNTADLSLTVSASTTTPAVGANFIYTVTVANAGTASASGVAVKDLLPAGVSYVSDDGAGAYVASTGVWTIPGSIAAGAAKSLQITAQATAAGSYVNFAEVTASGSADPDSTPNNSGAAPSEDDTAFVTVTAGGGGGGGPPALTCPAASGQLDWDANAWPSGSLSQNYAASSVPFALAFSGSTNRLINFGGAPTPATRTDLTGGFSPAQNSLLYVANFNNTSESITLTINAGSAGTGVAKLQFSIFDVDINPGGNNAGFVDQLQVTGALGGALVFPTLTAGLANTTSGPTATGVAASASTSSDGTVVVTFLSPVDTITITYGSGAGSPGNPGQQGVAVHDLNFCKAGTATLVAAKTVAIYDPAGAGLFATPGNDIVYTITSTNIGTGPADSNSIFVVDTLPPEIEFYNGDMDGAGPATGAAYFTQTGAGLSFSLATDLKFSNLAARPANLAACAYTPVAGYDPAVRHVCLRPQGAMQSGSPNPAFSAQFRARIK